MIVLNLVIVLVQVSVVLVWLIANAVRIQPNHVVPNHKKTILDYLKSKCKLSSCYNRNRKEDNRWLIH